jgi:molybdopterin-guanine dinucleotide biosynthesis protein A
MTGAILAGGRGRRMGTNKALLPFAGQRIIDGLVGKLRALFPEVLVVVSDPAPYAGLEVCTVRDRVPGKGPVGGIYTALYHSAFPHTFCIACDMPLANPALIAYLCQQSAGYDVVVPRTPDGYQPLHAVYGKGCLSHLEAMLRADCLRVEALFPAVRVRTVEAQELARVDANLASFVNVNTPEELDAALRLAAAREDESRQGPARGLGEGKGPRPGSGQHE